MRRWLAALAVGLVGCSSGADTPGDGGGGSGGAGGGGGV